MNEQADGTKNSSQIYDLFMQAVDLFTKGRYEEAIELAQPVTSCGDAELESKAHDFTGFCFYKQDDFPHAEAAFLEALKRRRWKGTLVLLAKICEFTDRDDEALSYLQQALELDNDYDEAHYLIGRQYRKREQLPLSEKHLRRAIELDGEYYLAMTELADCLSILNRLDESKSWLEKAIAIAPEYLWSGIAYSNLLWDLDEITEADEAYRRILEFCPEESITNWTYANFLSTELNNPSKAEDLFAKALQIDSQDASAHYYFGKHWLRRGDEEKAVAELSVAAELGHYHAPELLSEITSG